MGKPRGKYSKTGKIEQSDRDIADHHIELWNKIIADTPTIPALVYALRAASPSVRRLVFHKVFGPIDKRAGRPNRSMPDDLVLLAVESEKERLAAPVSQKVSYREAVLSCLKNNGLRLGRLEETPFNPDSAAGKKEVVRVMATLVRARKAGKSKIPPA